MDNIQFWIWLIVIIVTFIARAKKKKPEGDPTTFGGDPVDRRIDPADKPISFEDLLREIQASKAPLSAPVVTKKQEYVDYDDELEEEAVAERVDYSKRDQDNTFQTYERAKQDAFNRASLEETMKIEDTVVRFGQFKGYQQDTEVNVLAEYVKDLQDPAGFKKAFILSEVLNRKF
jgi:Skp family chaperone for outer membrane proteins